MSESPGITKAATFARWWEYRDLPNDRRVKVAATRAGLIFETGGLLFLTAEGRALRKEGQVRRALQATIAAGKAYAPTRGGREG